MKFVLLLFIISAFGSSVTKIGEYDDKKDCMAAGAQLTKMVASDIAIAEIDAFTKRKRQGHDQQVKFSCDIAVGKPAT